MLPPAVIGVGQTKYASARVEVSTPELIFEVASRAFADGAIDLSDIDAVVFASAPEVFEGVHEPQRWCADAFGGVNKPVLRVHTGGATGGSAALAGAKLVAGRTFETVLVVGVQRTTEAEDAQQIFTTIFDPIFERDIQLNVITSVALQASRQMQLFGVTEDHLAAVAVKNFENARRNPFAHLQLEVSEADVMKSRMLAWPLRLLHACPRSDGAAAVIITSGEKARQMRTRAWVIGGGEAADVYRIGDRIHDAGWDYCEQRALHWAAAEAYAQAGITDAIQQVDVIEMYAPFSNMEIVSYEALQLVPRGEGTRLLEEEATGLGGEIPVCPSGGCQTANPIGATGLVRFAEAALQVMGRAGEHQVDGARVGVATATGGIHQFFTVAVLTSELDVI
ncbi:MAG: thiolase C-terminal domain-containing protein [Actinomycetota bacterium]